MTVESESPKAGLSIEERLGIDYDSPEWKEGVLQYNNRVILKHDIVSYKLLVVRRLLREGNIGVLDQENQELLADFIDSALAGLPEAKRGRGRPHNDEINSIELMKSLSERYNKLHFEDGSTIEDTLQTLSDLSKDLGGKALSKKRIEQLCIEYNTYRPHYESRLYTLYSEESTSLQKQYRILVDDTAYIDELSSLSDCKPHELKLDDLNAATSVDLNLHRHAIKTLAQKYSLSEADVEKRINWEESGWDWHDIQEFRLNPLFDSLK